MFPPSCGHSLPPGHSPHTAAVPAPSATHRPGTQESQEDCSAWLWNLPLGQAVQVTVWPEVANVPGSQGCFDVAPSLTGHFDPFGQGSQVAAVSVVNDDLPAGGRYGGTPAKPVKQWFREVAAVRKLAERGGGS